MKEIKEAITLIFADPKLTLSEKLEIFEELFLHIEYFVDEMRLEQIKPSPTNLN